MAVCVGGRGGAGRPYLLQLWSKRELCPAWPAASTACAHWERERETINRPRWLRLGTHHTSTFPFSVSIKECNFNQNWFHLLKHFRIILVLLLKKFLFGSKGLYCFHSLQCTEMAPAKVWGPQKNSQSLYFYLDRCNGVATPCDNIPLNILNNVITECQGLGHAPLTSAAACVMPGRLSSALIKIII